MAVWRSANSVADVEDSSGDSDEEAASDSSDDELASGDIMRQFQAAVALTPPQARSDREQRMKRASRSRRAARRNSRQQETMPMLNKVARVPSQRGVLGLDDLSDGGGGGGSGVVATLRPSNHELDRALSSPEAGDMTPLRGTGSPAAEVAVSRLLWRISLRFLSLRVPLIAGAVVLYFTAVRWIN
jgi:hypothetical protein